MIPLGKYKDKPFSEAITDELYCDWVMTTENPSFAAFRSYIEANERKPRPLRIPPAARCEACLTLPVNFSDPVCFQCKLHLPLCKKQTNEDGEIIFALCCSCKEYVDRTSNEKNRHLLTVLTRYGVHRKEIIERLHIKQKFFRPRERVCKSSSPI
jgi:hypothetical protein